MPLPAIRTELVVTMSTGVRTDLLQNLGKETGTVGSEVREGAADVTVSGYVAAAADPA